MRVRREAAPFRRVTVARTERVGPRMVRVTLAGPQLEEFPQPAPGASIRLLVPLDDGRLSVPEWAGNEWLLPDGRRAKEWIRTYTPRAFRPDPLELDVDVVLHGGGVTSDWAAIVAAGGPAAISGPQRGYDIDSTATRFLLGGDESAIPAIGQIIEAIPPGPAVDVHIEVASPDGRFPLPDRPGTTVSWHEAAPDDAPGTALVAAVESADLPSGTKVWIAGEAASVQRIRRHLFDQRGVARSDAHVRGYWKHGRAGDDEA